MIRRFGPIGKRRVVFVKLKHGKAHDWELAGKNEKMRKIREQVGRGRRIQKVGN